MFDLLLFISSLLLFIFGDYFVCFVCFAHINMHTCMYLHIHTYTHIGRVSGRGRDVVCEVVARCARGRDVCAVVARSSRVVCRVVPCRSVSSRVPCRAVPFGVVPCRFFPCRVNFSRAVPFACCRSVSLLPRPNPKPFPPKPENGPRKPSQAPNTPSNPYT